MVNQEAFRSAIKGLMGVIEKHAPQVSGQCLRYLGDGLKTCENTGMLPCEICLAKSILEEKECDHEKDSCK